MRVVCTFWRGIESVRPFSCGFLRNPRKRRGGLGELTSQTQRPPAKVQTGTMEGRTGKAGSVFLPSFHVDRIFFLHSLAMAWQTEAECEESRLKSHLAKTKRKTSPAVACRSSLCLQFPPSLEGFGDFHQTSCESFHQL